MPKLSGIKPQRCGIWKMFLTIAARRFLSTLYAFANNLQLFITGTCGMIGSDDVLACFVAGNAFTIEYVNCQ
jgi:hypothetical protein